MSLSISNSYSPSALPAASASSNVAARPITQNTANNAADTVKISLPQQVYQLNRQGRSASQIAFQLNLTVETINSYLGTTNAK
jgi:DNA-binding NarL/FixJ family response regulator